MKLNSFLRSHAAVLVALGAALPATALDTGQKKEFHRIMNFTMGTLIKRSKATMERKYPEEEWDDYHFPSYVYTNDAVEIGYKIAAKEPETLVVATCACFCDEIGHTSLAHCFLKQGKRSAGYDEHAVDCTICLRQAMMAFLWADLGATDREIQEGMLEKFGVP